jgi:hypothetical protein
MATVSFEGLGNPFKKPKKDNFLKRWFKGVFKHPQLFSKADY